MELSIFGIISYSNEEKDEANFIAGRLAGICSTVFWFSFLVMAFIGITLQGINRTLGTPESIDTQIFASPATWFSGSIALVLLVGATKFRKQWIDIIRDYLKIRRAEIEEQGEGLLFVLQVFTDLLVGVVIGLVLGISAFFITMFVALPISLFLFLFFSGLRLPSLSMNFILSSTVAWGVGFFLPLQIWKRYLEQPSPETKPQEYYGLSLRAKEILKSEFPPIVCNSCGSFNAAERKLCIICNEKLNQEN